MKKIFSVVISLILILVGTALCFAEDRSLPDGVFVFDPLTDEMIDSQTGVKVNGVYISSNCTYNTLSKLYEYKAGNRPTDVVYCNICDGMIFTDYASITYTDGVELEVFRDGEIVDPSDFSALKTDGKYLVRDKISDKDILSFTLISGSTGAINSYRVPSAFYVASVKRDGKDVSVTSNTVDLSEDGLYNIRYKCNAANIEYNLNVQIDHSFPQLEIFGLDENNIANGPVTFGPIEYESKLVVTMDGETVGTANPIKTAGDYVAKYTDAAGNTSTYYFRVNIFLDGGAWLFVALVIAAIVLAVGFMIYSRKNFRVR